MGFRRTPLNCSMAGTTQATSRWISYYHQERWVGETEVDFNREFLVSHSYLSPCGTGGAWLTYQTRNKEPIARGSPLAPVAVAFPGPAQPLRMEVKATLLCLLDKGMDYRTAACGARYRMPRHLPEPNPASVAVRMIGSVYHSLCEIQNVHN